MATLSTQHEKELEKLRKEYQLEMTTAQKNFEEKFKTMRQAMEMQRKRDVHEVTERKNKHIKEMMAKHETDYENIRHYYNDIVSNNLDLVKSLKENIMSMKQTELRNEKLMLEIVSENKQMAEPFAKAVQEVCVPTTTSPRIDFRGVSFAVDLSILGDWMLLQGMRTWLFAFW